MQIKLTIDRFEKDMVVLITDDGTAITWPKNKLPSNSHEGSALIFEIQETTEHEKRSKQTAKDIINEIIQNS